MKLTSPRRILLTVILLVGMAPAIAAQDQAATAPIVPQNARETLSQFRSLMDRHPPSVRQVLRHDPTLMTNPEYLSRYPELAAFLRDHPEVLSASSYFIGDPQSLEYDPKLAATTRLWNSITEGIAIFVVVFTIAATLSWLIRTLIDYRRWSRISRIQAEVHNKLLDRFTTQEELLAYVQTPAGRQFLEGSSSAFNVGSAAPASPVSRILWSAQAGVVLAFGGIGLNYAIAGSADPEFVEPLSIIGVLAVALGLGFALSGAVSYALSRRLGLLKGSTTGDTTQTPATTP